MSRAERTKRFFETAPDSNITVLRNKKSNRLEVALAIHEMMEHRPYSKEDFVRKEFHTNLVGKE